MQRSRLAGSRVQLALFLMTVSCGGRDGVPSSPESVDAAPPNACGGSASLTFDGGVSSPGDPCGPCHDGALICASMDVLACVGTLPARFCVDAEVASDNASTPPDAAKSTPPSDASVDASTASQFADASIARDASAAVDASIDVAAEVDAAPGDAGPGWQLADANVIVDTLTEGGLPAVKCLAIAAGDLVLDPTRTLLYASVSGSSPQFGNSVIRIDPSSAIVTGTAFVGSNPNALAVSDDGASLYVGENGTASVRRVDLASGGVDAPVYLGTAKFEGARTARLIRAVPGSATRYVVSRQVASFSPSFSGLALYDGASLLGEWNGFVGGESIAFLSPTTLYGYNNDDTGFDLYEFDINPTGFQVVGDTMGLISGFSTEITGQGGWIFATNGQAVNGANGQPAGQYAASGPVWADPNETDVWFFETSTLRDFDRNTFLLKRSIILPVPMGGPTALVGWARTGFAFRTPSNICIVSIAPQ